MSNQEAVFQKFTEAQAANYAVGRAYSYPETLYQSLLEWYVKENRPRWVLSRTDTVAVRILILLASHGQFIQSYMTIICNETRSKPGRPRRPDGESEAFHGVERTL